MAQLYFVDVRLNVIIIFCSSSSSSVDVASRIELLRCFIVKDDGIFIMKFVEILAQLLFSAVVVVVVIVVVVWLFNIFRV